MATGKTNAISVSGGGGFPPVPSVTNVAVGSTGVLTFTAGDYSDLSDYSPSISYLVDINNGAFNLTTNTTSLDVSYYLSEGSNTIKVTTKAVLTATEQSGGTIQVVQYSLPAQSITILENQLNSEFSMHSINCTSIGTDIYIISGQRVGYTSLSFKIYLFDTLTETTTTMNSEIAIKNCAILPLNTNIYLLGGYSSSYKNTIYIYDTTSDTITTLQTTLPNGLAYMGYGIVGTTIYLLGGQMNSTNNGNTDMIISYDTTSDTITTLQTTLPTPRYAMGSATIGDKIYLFGGYNPYTYYRNVIIYDTTNDSVSTINMNYVSNVFYFLSASAINTNIFIFCDNGSSKSIYLFDTLTNSGSKLTLQAPYNLTKVASTTVSNSIYIFGNDNAYAKQILKFKR